MTLFYSVKQHPVPLTYIGNRNGNIFRYNVNGNDLNVTGNVMAKADVNVQNTNIIPLSKLLFAKLFCGVFRWFLKQESRSFV